MYETGTDCHISNNLALVAQNDSGIYNLWKELGRPKSVDEFQPKHFEIKRAVQRLMRKEMREGRVDIDEAFTFDETPNEEAGYRIGEYPAFRATRHALNYVLSVWE